MRTRRPAAHAAPVEVSLRIEGSGGTLYEGPLHTDARRSTAATGPARTPAVRGSPASALSARAPRRLRRRGAWNPDFLDFFVDRVGADSSNPATASYWAVLVNRRYTGGLCATGLHAGDEVLLGTATGR